MIKKTFKNVETWSGEKVDVVAFFHMSKKEVSEMIQYKKGLTKIQAEAAADEDAAIGVVDYIEDFIKKAYGKPAPDGLGFIKREEEANAFIHSPMYDMLFEELLSGGAEAIMKFMAQATGTSIDEMNKAYKQAEKERGAVKEIPEFSIESDTDEPNA
mgnify:CR=1 FL=1